jgi:hypothetical protein
MSSGNCRVTGQGCKKRVTLKMKRRWKEHEYPMLLDMIPLGDFLMT